MEKSLRQFLAVAELKNISQAAQRLFISQPTLTHNMKKLEASLGVDLFVRTARGVTLTPYGDKLLEQTRIMQRVHDNAMEELTRLKERRERGIRMGVGMAWWHLFFRDLLRQYRTNHPEAPVHIELGNHLRSMDQLLAGDIDLFMGHQIVGLHASGGAEFLPLFMCFDSAWVRAGHPLLLQPHCTPEDLLAFPHLDITPDETRYREVVQDLEQKEAQRSAYHLRERVVWSTSSMSAGLDILRESDAVMVYTSSMAPYFRAQGLEELPIDLPQPFTVGIYCLQERLHEPSVDHLIRLVRHWLSGLDLARHRLQPLPDVSVDSGEALTVEQSGGAQE